MVGSRFAVLVHCLSAVVAQTSDYQRPSPSYTLPMRLNQCADAVHRACAEQVHLALGGDGEMVVVFVSQSKATQSKVDWWCIDHVAAGSRPNGTAFGTASVYSHLMCALTLR